MKLASVILFGSGLGLYCSALLTRSAVVAWLGAGLMASGLLALSAAD